MYKLISFIIFISVICYADSWTSKASMSVARHGIGSAIINNHLYAIGGLHGESVNEVYNPAINNWTYAANMPYPRTGLPHGAVLNGEIYMIGGASGGYSNINSVYNPQTDSWVIKAPMPTPRFDIACAVVDHKIYAIGGCGYSGELNTVEVYHPLGDSWTTSIPMPTARTGPVCAVYNGKIYVISGRDPGFNYLNVNECYDPSTNTWTTCAPMPTPRCYPACVELGGLIYVISGLTAQNEVTANEAYDPINNTWHIKTPIPTPRKGPAFGVINGKIYVAGGSNGYTGYLTVNEEYTPDVSTTGHDVGVITILEPIDTIFNGTTVIPTAVVKNFGEFDETFYVFFNIGCAYSDFRSVSLNAGETDTITFDSWLAITGYYNQGAATYLETDENPENDTVTAWLTVIESETQEVKLYRPYPNPTYYDLVIDFILPNPSNVELTIYDITGRKLKSLISETRLSGFHKIKTNCRELENGIYFVKMKTEKFYGIEKLIVIK